MELVTTFFIIIITMLILKLFSTKTVDLFVLIIKTFVNIYDMITYPLYFIVDQPWKIDERKKKPQSIRHYEPNGNYYYWTTAPNNNKEPKTALQFEVEKMTHVSDYLRIANKFFFNEKCVGKREIISREKVKNTYKFMLSDYKWQTYGQFFEEVQNLTKLFYHKFNLRKGDKVAIMADTSPNWLATFLSLQNLGCIVVTLHTTLGKSGITHILNATEVDLLITQTDSIRLLNELKEEIKFLKSIIHIENGFVDELTEEEKHKISFKIYDFLDLKEESLDLKEIEEKFDFDEKDIAVIMYTSGSTGIPKGVLLSHFNFVECSKSVVDRIQETFKYDNKDTLISYLPLSHILEMQCELSFLICGVKLAYGKPLTLVTGMPNLAEKCLGDIQVSKVTIWAGVPLIFERIQSKIKQKLKSKSLFLSALYDFAYDYKQFWSEKGHPCKLINLIFFNRVNKMFGGNLNTVFTGGAPLMLETQKFIKTYLKSTLLLGYSSTECTANGCLKIYDEFDSGNSTVPLKRIMVRLDDWQEGGYFASDKPNPRGEILIGSTCVSPGYFNDLAQTESTFFDQNNVRWWRSGDIGEINDKGELTIVDRKKDLIKLQFGEYIALGKAEAVLKNCKYVENIVLNGNSFHNFLIGLIMPNKENIIKLANTLNKEVKNVEELFDDEEIKNEVLKEMNSFGKTSGLLSKEIPLVIKLCKETWLPSNELLTATLKISRTKLYSFYKEAIEKLYVELEEKVK